jgi:Gluconate 2-dehydrogenase subunit 3
MLDDPRPHAFSVEEARTLASVLDYLLPPSSDGRLPGAGALGVGRHVEAALAKAPDLRAMVVEGLGALVALARRRNADGFGALPPAERLAALDEQGFVFPLLFQACTGYYQHPKVLEHLGLDPRPPHPKGYELAPGDLTLLDPVRRRAKLYRS